MLVMFGTGRSSSAPHSVRPAAQLVLSASALWNDLALVIATVALCWAFGWKAVLIAAVAADGDCGAAGVWLFYVQHQFEHAYWVREDAPSVAMQGSSFYDLPQMSLVHRQHRLPPSTTRRAACRITGCASATSRRRRCRPPRIGLLESLRRARCKLWDEAGRMVGFCRGVGAPTRRL
jgi:omega-6 fatty acid desaturase (delta-12 desaturase)